MESVFESDGSLRDIYIRNTNLGDWQLFLDFLKEGKWNINFYKDSERTNYISFNAMELFDERKNHTTRMTIMLGSLSLNCHFFSEDEIELDIDPAEVKNSSMAESILIFMAELANRLNREVIITPENSPNTPFVCCKPNTFIIEYMLTGQQYRLPF